MASDVLARGKRLMEIGVQSAQAELHKKARCTEAAGCTNRVMEVRSSVSTINGLNSKRRQVALLPRWRAKVKFQLM